MPGRFLVAIALASAALAATGGAGRSAPHRSAGDPCRPTADPACTAGAFARERGAARDAASLTSDGTELGGLGLPTFAAVAGAGPGEAARRSFNSAIVGLFTRPFPKPRGRNPAAAQAPLTRVSSPFSVTWSTPVDGVGATLGARQLLRSGARLYRDIQIHVVTGRCPKMYAPSNANGSVELAVAGSYALSAIWTRGGRQIERHVLITLSPMSGTGFVNREARFDYTTMLRDASVRVTTTNRVRQGKRGRRWGNTVLLDATAGESGWDVKLGGDFERFIDQTAQRGDDDPPPPYDGPLVDREAVGKAYAGVVKAFLRLIDATMQRSIATAEREWWQKPNECAKVDWAPPAGKISLSQGATTEIRGRIIPSVGGPDGKSSWSARPRQLAGKILRQLTDGSGPDRPLRLEVQAGSPRGGLAVHFRWRVPSTVGTAEAEWTAKALVFPAAWSGQGTYEYTQSDTATGVNEMAKLNAMITLRQLSRDSSQYQATGGSLRWEASGSSPNCTWTAMGSRPANKYDLFLQLDVSALPYRASFAAQDSIDVTATQTCTYGQKTEVRQIQESLLHPFFALGRITEGIPVSSDLKQISGSRAGSQNAGSSSFRYSLSFGFLAAK